MKEQMASRSNEKKDGFLSAFGPHYEIKYARALGDVCISKIVINLHT
jgi:hypothetical protein